MIDHLRRLTVRRRIIGGFMVLTLLIALSIPLVVANHNFIVNRLRQVTNVETRADRLLLLASARVESSRVNLMRYIEDYAPSTYEALDDVDLATQLLTEAHDLITSSDQKATVASVLEALAEYKTLIGAAEAEQETNPDVNPRLIFQAHRLGNDIGQQIEQIVEDSEARITAANQTIYAAARTRLLFLMVGYAGVLFLAFALSTLIERSITQPVAELRDGTEAFRSGHTDTAIPVVGTDELSQLARAFNQMASQLHSLIGTLEQRVAERVRGMQTAAEVARATTAVLDPEELLRQVVDLVRQRFGLYYVGLFLLDEESGDSDRTFAVLRAGTGKAGQEMLAQGHKLIVGGESMIGQCVARAEARIALDVGEEAVRFDNPFLPETRSELALPLRSRGQIIGAMTVQSIEANAFDEAYIAILQTMADQVAVAIDNARLFTNAQVALEELEATHRRYLGQAWSEHALTRAISGYQQTEAGITPLGDQVLSEVQQALIKQRPVIWGDDEDSYPDQTEASSSSTLVVPIVLRDQPIGALGFKGARGQRQWNADDIALVEAIAEQLALAADNLRLLQETQRSLGEAEALYSASQAIGAASSVEEVGQALIDFAANSGVDAARVLLFEHNEQGEPTYIVVREGWTVDERPAQPDGTRLLLADYPLADLMHPHQPIIVQDMLTDERANEMARNLIITISRLRSFIMVPITVGTRWIGMLFAGRNEPSAFAEELVRGYETLTGQAAVALESIRLLAETRQRAERERLISAVTARIRESLDMEIVLQTAVREIGETLGLHDAMVQLNVDADPMDRQNIERMDL
jgi:GAF domain-containing protein/HAMP domain-containing protein